MIKNIKKTVVKYNGRIVGYLAEIKNGKIAFQYDATWLKNGFSISPLSLPLKEDVFISDGNFFKGLYGVFWDSLPDGWGELLLNRYLTSKGINPAKISILTKLSLVGSNGLGGLNYEPDQATGKLLKKYDFDDLSKEIEIILKDNSVGVDLDKIYALGGSSGGARPKAHLRLDGRDWIVKFACRADPEDVGKKEFAANKVAEECGINVNEYALFPSSLCSGYFGAKRFDRKDGTRVHMISLSSLLETTHRLPNLDYSHLFQVIQVICVEPDKQLYEAFRRMCFNVFYGNKDDHGKNFSFLYDEKKGGYVLSPAYDMTRTPDKLEHEMTVNGNGVPQKKDILAVAAKFGLSMSECKTIMENTERLCRE